jgi:5-methyltetrahydropteroyltriglutamate--homocysteine methyltransferase
MEKCTQYSLELANKDATTLGTREGDRPGYDVLKLFKEYNVPGRIGLGVTDIHSDFDEPEELVRDRILYVAGILGPENINPQPDCGLRTRNWEVAFRKMKKTVDGARLAEQQLGY